MLVTTEENYIGSGYFINLYDSVSPLKYVGGTYFKTGETKLLKQKKKYVMYYIQRLMLRWGWSPPHFFKNVLLLFFIIKSALFILLLLSLVSLINKRIKRVPHRRRGREEYDPTKL
jgi:hypothetical protein